MKITFCSDLHLEIGVFDQEWQHAPQADVLVLAGDIFVAAYLASENTSQTAREEATYYKQFIETCCEQYAHVVYVMGNHEHYQGDFSKTANIIEASFAHHNNFYFLNNGTVDIEGVLFVGGTLWTNFNAEDEETINAISHGLNDYRQISFTDANGERLILATDLLHAHHDTLSFINHTVSTHPQQSIVVVTHHAPSRNSKHPYCEEEDLITWAYQSELDDFIKQHPHIQLWIHGHTHQKQHYAIDQTQIVCNPRGYVGYEPCAYHFEWETIDI